jgi:ABC-type multidrug transport system ATPase subunit
MATNCAVCKSHFPAGARTCPRCGEPREPRVVVRVGRERDNDVVLEAPSVSPHHAVVRLLPTGDFLIEEQAEANGTFVNGVRTTRHEFTLVDEVRLGTTVLPMTHRALAGLLLDVTRTFDAKIGVTLGSSPDCELVVAHPSVAPRHALLRANAPGQVDIVDLSGGRLFVDKRDFPVELVRLLPRSVIWLGACPIPIAVLLHRLEGLDRARVTPRSEILAPQSPAETFTIGRAPESDVVVDHPSVSRAHARLVRRANGSMSIEDLGSANGTYLEGQPVGRDPVTVRAGQLVVIGAVEMLVGEGGSIVDVRRPRVSLELEAVTVTLDERDGGKPKKLLDAVSLFVAPGEVIALLGPSGAGKTTLLHTLLGITRPTSGVVRINDRPLAEVEHAFRASLGYVPQDDIVHPQLTVAEALRYACKLRLPKDTDDIDIEDAITRTLEQVGLTAQRDLIVGSPDEKVLSGGQRRRVNLAVELVADPTVLVLDEPTSGLSWSDAADVIATLRRLADAGRTIVVTIHQPDVQEYESFDSVAILGRGGKLLFFGPPSPESYDFFGAERGRPRAIFDRLEQVDVDTWRERYEASEVHERFVVERKTQRPAMRSLRLPAGKRRSRVGQLLTLIGRTTRLTFRQRATVALMLIQAPLLGLLIAFASQGSARIPLGVFGCIPSADDAYIDTCVGVDDQRACDNSIAVAGVLASHEDWSWNDESTRRTVDRALGFRRTPVRDPRTGLLSVLLSLFLPMVIVSATSLVSERTIYAREQLAGLDPGAYVLSRFIVLASLGVVVTLLNTSVAIPLLGLRGGLAPYYLVGSLVSAAAVAMGLLLSAVVQRPTSALWGINFLVIPQLLFAGTITRLAATSEVVSRFTATRPALEALAHVHLSASGTRFSPCQIARWMEAVPGFEPVLVDPLKSAATTLGLLISASLALAVTLMARRPG